MLITIYRDEINHARVTEGEIVNALYVLRLGCRKTGFVSMSVSPAYGRYPWVHTCLLVKVSPLLDQAVSLLVVS